MRKKQTVASMTSMISFVPMCIWKVQELMKGNTYDLINTHFAIPSGPAGQYISRKYDIPNVLTILGGDIIDPSKFLSPHNTFLLNQTVRKMLFGADRVVAESTDIKRNAQKYYGFDRQVDIVPLGIYPNTHPEKSRHALGLPSDKFIFVTIGRLVKRKNLEDLLHIFKDVQETIPSILLIIGDGPEKDNIESLSKQLGIDSCGSTIGEGFGRGEVPVPGRVGCVFVDGDPRRLRHRISGSHGMRVAGHFLRPRRSNGLFAGGEDRASDRAWKQGEFRTRN